MLENEEPWLPPTIQKLPGTPTIRSQVPEVTIISSETQKNDGSPSNQVFLKQLGIKPSVPDLSIVDNKMEAKMGSAMTKSYKEMLRNTHDEIRTRSTKEDFSSTTKGTFGSVKQGLLSKTSQNYRPNPLCKYVPSKVSSPSDGNSSSILNESSTLDDVQLKSVAGILSEIQKLVTPLTTKEVLRDPQEQQSEILKNLAKIYLSSDEYLKLAKEEFE